MFPGFDGFNQDFSGSRDNVASVLAATYWILTELNDMVLSSVNQAGLDLMASKYVFRWKHSALIIFIAPVYTVWQTRDWLAFDANRYFT
jgi:hypothetical protein